MLNGNCVRHGSSFVREHRKKLNVDCSFASNQAQKNHINIHSSGANCHLIKCASYAYRYAHLRAKGGAAAWAMQESDYFRSLEAPAKRRHVEKLSIVGFSLEDDPYLPKNEVRFSDDMTTWPQIEFGNISTFFILRPGLYTQEQLLLWKQLDSYNFFQAGYARSVFSLTF